MEPISRREPFGRAQDERIEASEKARAGDTSHSYPTLVTRKPHPHVECHLPVGIFADDLTGALDAAAPFARLGIGAYVSIYATLPASAAGYEVAAVNMDSRHAVQFQPFDRAARATRELRAAGRRVLLNKIDSTLRGHAGMEARAALSPEPPDQLERPGPGEWLGPRVAVVAPAFPAMGRTVVGGVLRVDGVPVGKTDVGRDPLSPAPSSDVREVVEANTGAVPAFVPLDTLRQPGALSAELARLAARPPALIVVDAATEADLDAIAGAGLAKHGDAVFSGSAGIATAIARLLAGRNPAAARAAPAAAPAVDGPVLAVAGSRRDVTARQIDRLSADRGVTVVEMDTARLLDDGQAPRERARSGDAALEVLRSGAPLVLRLMAGSGNAALPASLEEQAKLAGELGAAAYRLCRATFVGALVLVGGDTAQAVLRAVGADGIVLRAEPLPGIAAGTIEAGLMGGKPMVSKAGAFGADEALVDVLDYLGGRPPAL